jgi:hypothetical protein
MTNVIEFRTDRRAATDESGEPDRRLAERFGVDQQQLRATIMPLLLLMYDHGIGSVKVDREGAKALITIDGKPV